MDFKKKVQKLREKVAEADELVDIDSVNTGAVNDYCADKTAQEVARLLKDLKEANEEADRLKKQIGKCYDHVRIISMPEAMDNDGLESPFTVVGVGKVVLTDDIRVKVKDKEGSYEWLRDTGNGDIITETVNASTLSALIRRLMREGEEVPTEVYEITPLTRAVINQK